MEKSKIIVIEGTDGSGKATQAEILKDTLTKKGYNVFSISFPNYESVSSSLVKMYLSGDISKNPDDVSSKAASTFYAADRYITYKKYMEDIYNEGKSIIILDRYTTSNIVHQGAKDIKGIEDEEEKKMRLKELISWVYNLEYNDLQIPKEDVVIYLNVPIDYTINLRKGRNNKFTGNEVQDIHESNNEHLKNASISGNIACDMLNWNRIECIRDGNMRSKEDIASEILEKVEEILN